MTQPPHLSSEHLPDEELSAHADAALDRPATRAAEKHLAACEECARRREGLLRARSLLQAAPVEPVDELTRRRLVARAVAPRRDRGRLLAVAAIALVTVGSVALIRLNADETSTDAKLASGLPIGAENMGAAVGGLDDPEALRSWLLSFEARPASSGLYDEGEATGGGLAGGAGSGGADSASQSQEVAADDAVAGETRAVEAPPLAGVETRAATAAPLPATPEDVAAVTRCFRAVQPSLSDDQRLVAALVGTYSDQPVIVLGFRSASDRVLAMVLGRDDCTIVIAHTFR